MKEMVMKKVLIILAALLLLPYSVNAQSNLESWREATLVGYSIDGSIKPSFSYSNVISNVGIGAKVPLKGGGVEVLSSYLLHDGRIPLIRQLWSALNLNLSVLASSTIVENDKMFQSGTTGLNIGISIKGDDPDSVGSRPGEVRWELLVQPIYRVLPDGEDEFFVGLGIYLRK